MCTFDGKPKQDTLSKLYASLRFIYVKIYVYYSREERKKNEMIKIWETQHFTTLGGRGRQTVVK